MSRSQRYSPEVRERAVRMVFEHEHEHTSQWAAITSIAHKIGCTPETLRKWVRDRERDEGRRSGPATDEWQRYHAELRHFLDFCKDEGWVTTNAATELHKSTPRRKRRQNRDLTEYLSPAEVRRIVKKDRRTLTILDGRAGACSSTSFISAS